MNIETELVALAEQIQTFSDRITTSITVLSEDSMVLDVRIDGRLFVLDYDSQEGFGVDEFVWDRDGLGSDFEYNSPDLNSAKRRLTALVHAVIADQPNK